jgi:hypothetical protein
MITLRHDHTYCEYCRAVGIGKFPSSFKSLVLIALHTEYFEYIRTVLFDGQTPVLSRNYMPHTH